MSNTVAKAKPSSDVVLRIGELAERSGRTIHAIRYYESIGLLPFVSRDAQGRRSFRSQHVQWLAFLERLQRTGMSLAQMQKYARLVISGKGSVPERLDLLKEHLKLLERELEEIKLSRKILKEKIDFYQVWHSTGHRPREIWAESLAALHNAKRKG